jgi:WD40 repeat protein
VSSAAAAVSPDGRWLFNEQNDGMLAAWQLEAGLDAFRISVGAPIRSLTASERGGWVAAGTDNGEVAIVSVDSWKERRRLRLPGPPAPIDRVAASADGRWLAVAQSQSLHVFDTSSGREVVSRKYKQDVAAAAFVPGDRWLVVTTGNTVVVWEAGRWRERQRLEHDRRIETVRFGPEGRRLVTTIRLPTTGHDVGMQLTRVFDLASGNETGWEYTAPGGSNISQQFMREEAARKHRALAGGDTASVRAAASLWPAMDLKDTAERVSADGLWHVRFSLFTATLSDVASGRTVGDFDHGNEITAVRFVPSRAPRWLVTAGNDGTLAVWPLRSDDLVHEACARLKAIFDPQALKKLIADAHAEGSCDAK